MQLVDAVAIEHPRLEKALVTAQFILVHAESPSQTCAVTRKIADLQRLLTLDPARVQSPYPRPSLAHAAPLDLMRTPSLMPRF
jgi:hypothetical protein